MLLLYLVSPYYSLWRFQSALASGDRDSLEERIDFPAVRDSLKDQIRVQMTESAAKDKKLQGNPLAGLATALAPMMVNYVVDNTVTPSGISALIADSKSAMKKPDSETADRHTKKAVDWSKLHYAFFTGPSRFMVDLDGTKLRFGFTGLGWQLKKIEIPKKDM